jgi:hypothetical protein
MKIYQIAITIFTIIIFMNLITESHEPILMDQRATLLIMPQPKENIKKPIEDESATLQNKINPIKEESHHVRDEAQEFRRELLLKARVAINSQIIDENSFELSKWEDIRKLLVDSGNLAEYEAIVQSIPHSHSHREDVIREHAIYLQSSGKRHEAEYFYQQYRYLIINAKFIEDFADSMVFGEKIFDGIQLYRSMITEENYDAMNEKITAAVKLQ